jgi:hypothetical protein
LIAGKAFIASVRKTEVFLTETVTSEKLRRKIPGNKTYSAEGPSLNSKP